MSEYKKCKVVNRELIPCEWLVKSSRGVNGHDIGITFADVCTLSNLNSFNGGAIYRWSKKKNDLVYINYCPFCGENIQTR